MMQRSFWKDGLSINETKFSIIGLLTVVVSLFTLVYLHMNEVIPLELLDLNKAFLLSFVGINAVDKVSSAFGNNQSE